MPLPIDELRPKFDQLLQVPGPEGRGARLVVCATTGAGKSTRVPLWCPGRVLVVQPRRISCRALALRVAEQLGEAVGEQVGYRVRDESKVSDKTRIEFVTPGVALKALSQGRANAKATDVPRGDRVLSHFDTVILDEVHERRIDTDLLMALLRRGFKGRLVAMSATVDGEAFSDYLDGQLLIAEGRRFPVQVHHRPGAVGQDGMTMALNAVPSAHNLASRVASVVREALDTIPEGDILVFLPGKGEISRVWASIQNWSGVEIMRLHGGMPLTSQTQVLSGGIRRRVILSTNVAETSLTVPGVRVVIDAGLVRQTRYQKGRGFLTLVAIAQDSADQRRGRAGRTAPGVCFRLWGESAKLQLHTPPEIYRESLADLVLGALACGAQPGALKFLTPPHPHALDAAREELMALGAIDTSVSDDAGGDRLNATGMALWGTPLDPQLARFLIEAQRYAADRADGFAGEVLAAVADLVAGLSIGRSLYQGAPQPADPYAGPDAPPDPRSLGCDGRAIVAGVRGGPGVVQHGDRTAVGEAQLAGKKLRRLAGVSRLDSQAVLTDRHWRAVAQVLLRADPRSAHVARRRKREVAWAAGGPEVQLAKESAVQLKLDDTEGLVVLESRAFGEGTKRRIVATCAMPTTLADIGRAGIGRSVVSDVRLRDGALVAQVRRVHAQQTVAVTEDAPQGDAAREAIAKLLFQGALPAPFAKTRPTRSPTPTMSGHWSKTSEPRKRMGVRPLD